MNLSKYHPNWPERSKKEKELAHWCCTRCGHPHDPYIGFSLTVQHLDRDISNPDALIQALCQRCHMRELGTRVEYFRERERLGQLTLFYLAYKFTLVRQHI